MSDSSGREGGLTMSEPSKSSSPKERHAIPIAYVLFYMTYTFLTFPSYRTMSIHVETLQDKPVASKRIADPASAIRNIDAHLLSPDQLFTRYSSSPVLGLEDIAVQRRLKAGKNVISPPPTHYWKKILNYVFGGFNFLMWIAFIVTIVCNLHLMGASITASARFPAFLPASWEYRRRYARRV